MAIESTAERVLAIRRANPEASTRLIAKKAGISNVMVWKILHQAGAETPRIRSSRAGEVRQPPKSKPEIRPHMMPGLTLSLLMGGKAPRAKLQPA
jgi:hypothetical protein